LAGVFAFDLLMPATWIYSIADGLDRVVSCAVGGEQHTRLV